MHAAVIGSGLAGTFCALALSRRGVKVTVLDVGRTLDEARQSALEQARALPPAEWPASLKATLGIGRGEDWGHGIPRKLAFGSGHVYGDDAAHSPIVGSGEFIPPSFARGGYSNVWGATMLPYSAADIADWPLSPEDLAPFYRTVLHEVPLTGARDSLAAAFPLLKDEATLERPELGSQMRGLLADLAPVATVLETAGIYHGLARLGVHCRPATATIGCINCGYCLYGCAMNAIYSASETLDPLLRAGAADYRGGVVVRTVREEGERVRVSWTDEQGANRTTETFDRVFLGAGALGSTRIMLESLGLFDREVTLRESQKFLIPMLRKRGAGDVFDDRTMRLPGAFIEILDRKSGHWFHIQMSPMNDMVLHRLRLRQDSLSPLAKRLLAPLFGRLVFGWGGIHSDESPELSLHLRRETASAVPVLHVGSPNPDKARPALRRLQRMLRQHAGRMRMLPVNPMAILPKPGGGHNGGSFPMSAAPAGTMQSDLLGRPAGLTRIHLVDSSAFPSIPATTIGLTIMANAYRIGNLVETR